MTRCFTAGMGVGSALTMILLGVVLALLIVWAKHEMKYWLQSRPREPS